MKFPDSSMLSLDEIINSIGFGKFHLKQYLAVFLISLNCLTHSVLSGYILPAITNQWRLSILEQSFLGILEYSMQVLASLLTAYSSPFGRKKPIIISMLIWTGSVFFTCFFNNFYGFCIFRSSTACFSLLCNLISYTSLSEILPNNNRGKWLGSFEFVIILGHLQLIMFMLGSFKTLGEGDIQLLMFFLSLSMIITCGICLLFTEESPRYLSFHGKINECIILINHILQQNRNNREIIYFDTEKTENFKKWIKYMEEEEKKKVQNENVGFSSLFKGNYKNITITLYFVWFANCFVSAGNDYILPLTLFKVYSFSGESENLMLIMLYMNILILPLLIPAVFAIDVKRIGRKKTLTFSLLLLGVSCLFVWLDCLFNIFIWLIMSKYAISINYMILSLYTNEIYTTKMRSLGYGTSVTVGKIGSIFSPLISVFLSDSNPLLPFGFFALISLIGGVLFMNLKHDTTNEDMDRILKDDCEMMLVSSV